MKKFTTFLSIMVMVFFLVATANAGSILYFNDYCVGTDQMAAALAAVAADHTTTTVTSSADFATEIAGGTYDLGIFMKQNYYSGHGDGIYALGDFVAGGGAAIYTDWTRNDTYAALFEAAWTGGVNDSPVYVTDPSLDDGITNPIVLTNPGWGVFSMDVDGPDIAARFDDPVTGDGAIAIGHSGRAIVNGFLTDTFSVGSQGVQLYMNEIDYLIGDEGAPVPEPSTIILFLFGLLGMIGLKKKFN